MTPMLWISGISASLCLPAAVVLKDKEPLCTILAIVGILPVLVACGMYVYFGIKDPDRLHSEEYRLRDRILKLTETKGGKIAVNPLELTEIANPFPDAKALTYKAEATKEDESAETSEEGGHA
jgi:hypothetical protein